MIFLELARRALAVLAGATAMLGLVACRLPKLNVRRFGSLRRRITATERVVRYPKHRLPLCAQRRGTAFNRSGKRPVMRGIVRPPWILNQARIVRGTYQGRKRCSTCPTIACRHTVIFIFQIWYPTTIRCRPAELQS